MRLYTKYFMFLLQLVIGAAGLIAGMVAIVALIVQSNQVKSICETVIKI